LLAAGDDKVVRAWPFDKGKLTARARLLRWRIFREKLGSIYAMALSPDEKLVAIGGLGIRAGEVAVLDRATGKVEHARALDRALRDEDDFGVQALTFSPDGKSLVVGKADGTVWLWPLKEKYARKVGRFSRFEEDYNPVRLLHFLDEQGKKLLAVTEDG